MIKFAVSALLLVFVSCKSYPGEQKSFRAPALDLLTGGVSEFNVDGRTYGRDLPPLLTGKTNIPPLYGNGDQLLGDGFLNLEGSSSGNSFQSVAGINSEASPAIPSDFQFRDRHSGIKSSGIPFQGDHIPGIYPETKGLPGFDGFSRQDTDISFGPIISNDRQFRNKQNGIKSNGISFQSDHISGIHPETKGFPEFDGFTGQEFGPIISKDRHLRNRNNGIKSSGISFHSDHRSGIYPETKGLPGFDGFARQDTDISFGPAISSDRPFRNQHSGIEPNRPPYIAGGNLGSGPFTGSVSDITYPESRLLDTGRSRESRPWTPKKHINKGEAQKIAFPPQSFPTEPINNIPFSVNSRSIGRGEWRRDSVGPVALPYPSIGTHSSGIKYSGIKAQADIDFGSSGIAQGRPFGSGILNSRRPAFFGGSRQRESIRTPYPVDHRETKFDTSLINTPKQSKNDFNSFGFPQSQIIHGDDLVSFGRTSTRNVPARIHRSFEGIRQISSGGKFPSVYQPGRTSIAQFQRINSRRPGNVWEQSIGDSAFESNILKRNPRVGKIPTGGKHYRIPKVL
ncbi:uncharacterized protein LOC125651447 isoform X2 [Ostrea edulis]|uniref:uncharacterized protein LOC125651447 isoform X2 n=1 Tax=Ostrea edulis TaxID=37623 RepID=UPI0024AEB46D|nr:uncharacterized protein LOC125651447 isoform X2 [Ostrea edulis]